MVAVKTRQTAQVTRAEHVAAWMLPSLTDLIFVCVLFAVLFGLQGKLLGYDGDSGWHISIGEYTLAHGLPRTEVLLATSYGQPHIYYEWLGQLAYGLAHHLGGLNGVVTLASLLIALAGAGIFAALRRRGLSPLPALALTLLGLPLTAVTWTARAQLFTLVLALWWSEHLWRYLRDGNIRRLWALPPVLALWANLHGGFIVGLLLLATTSAVLWLAPAARGMASLKALALTLGACLLAPLATPWGVALPLHIFGFLSDPLISRYTLEFQSPDFHTALPLLFLALSATLSGLWLWLASHRDAHALDPLAFAHTAIWTALTFYSVRYVAIWAVVALPLLAEALVASAPLWRATAVAADDPTPSAAARHVLRPLLPWLARADAISRRMGEVDALVGRGVWAALAVVVVLLTVADGGALPGASTPALAAGYDPQVFPVQAVERLRTRGVPAGLGFNTYTWGGYLDETLPEYRPFIDSRSDEYSETLLADYLTITQLAPGWRQTLDRYGVMWALLPHNEPLAQALALLPSWRCVPADDTDVAVLCVRASAQASIQSSMHASASVPDGTTTHSARPGRLAAEE